jgi:hypothetical protein
LIRSALVIAFLDSLIAKDLPLRPGTFGFSRDQGWRQWAGV